MLARKTVYLGHGRSAGQHIPAPTWTSAGIKQASDDWDAVSDSCCDHTGWPIDEEGCADGLARLNRDIERLDGRPWPRD
ncbi:hypothetical protein AB0C61_33390 [Streptomyces sp. NPDC048680]|uniref:hypothetical protein n=1 Tax=Streptomyces sp. NPDC048680 TaxID=3155492 RepID=UPI00342DA552